MKQNNNIYVWKKNKDRREKVVDGMVIEDYDRRQRDDPNYCGPERRSGEDRRSVKHKKIILLITENPDDERLAFDTFHKNNIVNELVVARDGAEALDYLFANGVYSDRDAGEMPHVIFLDLNFQKRDGLKVLKRLRGDERTNLIPLVVFTSSMDNQCLTDCYKLGVNSFIRKPTDPVQLVNIIGQLDRYWLALNESPPQEKEFRNKPIRVLIVEDSEDDTFLILRQLKKEGYNPTYDQVDTAEAMRNALEKQTWDIVLCDNSMPGFSAVEALDIYKEKRLDLPFIIVSGAMVYENVAAIMAAGAHDYILKNDLAELTPAIDRALRKVKT